MPTFIYAPGIKVYISTAKNGIVDISEDLIEGTMVRRSDGVSTFNTTLSNPQRKYDSVFTPNDRIIVSMKRLAWLRTFTGLLNSVPLITAWPKPVNLAASCSLKRLQYWYWDAHTSATQAMIAEALAAVNAKKTNTDGGITNVVLTILDKVVGWPASKVHISQIPDNWFDIAEKVAASVDSLAETSDRLREEFYTALGQRGAISGTTGRNVNGVLSEGMYGGVALSIEQVRNAETIYSVGKGMGASDRDITIALATAMQESTLHNLDHGDRDSVGLFQQRPSAGWGTVAQITTPEYAARKFFEALLRIPNRDSMSETQAAQAVQRSAFPSAYQKWVAMGQQVVRVINSKGATIDPVRSASPGASTGEAMAQVAVDFIQRHPRVMYGHGGGAGSASYLGQEPPPNLDCGSFIQAMYLRTLGALGGMPRTVTDITAWALSNGGRRLTVDEAINTPGALMIKTQAHVEMSLGDGTTTAGSKSWGKPAQLQSSSISGIRSYWDFGLTVPGLRYNIGGTVPSYAPGNGGTATGGDAALNALSQPTLGSELPGYNPNDPFDKLFGNNSWYPTGMGTEENLLSEGLTGIRALLNDQPLLPYLMNLFNSTMRSFCSAPNGDLIAWFPDYYGLWGTAAKMVVEPIEVLDFNVDWSDDSFVTHQFTMAAQEGGVYLDVSSGADATNFLTGGGADIRTQTLGIASIDIPAIMWALFGIEPTTNEANNFANFIYKRFGARPSFQPMPGLQGPKAEFFSALFMFMRQWAYQYNADLPLTFMPELFPGMLIQIPAFDFQAYVTTVTHTFRFGDGGGFSTSVNIAAPARLPKRGEGRDNVLIGLPLAGDFKPGRGVGNVAPRPSEGLSGDYVFTNGRKEFYR